jgi:drug/metabolite transporter (DMT)-like permease
VTVIEFGLFLLSIVAGVSGQYFLKLGAIKLGKLTANNLFSHVLGIVLYILLMTRVKLSVLAPAVALQYVFSVLMGYFFFRESIPLVRLFGMGFIICGVVMLLAKE